MRRFQVSIAALAAALAVAGGAHAQSTSAELAEITASVDDASLYGAFLSGRSALLGGDTRAASQRLALAAEGMPGDAYLRERAFMASLFAGEIGTAARMAPAANPENPAIESLGRLTVAVEALATGQAPVAAGILAPGDLAIPHSTAGALLRPWAQAAAGDWDAALAEPPFSRDRIAQLFGSLARAQLLEIRRDYKQAEPLLKALAEDEIAGSLFAPMYGDFLERRGRRADALAVYDRALAGNPEDISLLAAKDRVSRRGKAPRPLTLQEGAGQALGFAAAAINAQRQEQLSIIYLRLALRIDPGLHQAWMLVGDGMEKAGNEAGAREAWLQVPAGSAYYSESRSKLAYSYFQDQDAAGALRIARETVEARPADLRAALTLADMLRASDKHEEAIAILTRLVDQRQLGWRPYFMRAISYDATDRWPDAERDLVRALEMAPNEPELLNFLGYSWIDHGQKVQEGMALVQRAVAARPESGAMQDSLAWAHYRLGDYPKAVELLELAISLSPADPEINDHLGDAYWMVGRRDEASFQWRRVLTLDPPADIREAAERKLKDGLTPPVRVAGQGASE